MVKCALITRMPGDRDRNGWTESMNRKIKQPVVDIVYAFYRKKAQKSGPDLQVLSIEDTIQKVKTNEMSMVRFGDGEIQLIRGRDLSFQKCDPTLRQGIIDALTATQEKLMVTIPDIFDGLDQYIAPSQEFWKDHLLIYRKIYRKYCDPNRVYGNTSISRLYLTFKDQSRCRAYFDEVKSLWSGKKVTIIEGAGSHNGVGNDLLDNTVSVERIICPATQAYSCYDRIVQEADRTSPDRLILIALGPSAKPLVLHLVEKGRRALDIGNLDTEYEWFLHHAKEREPIPKHEILTEEDNRKAGYLEYLGQIRARIELEV